MAGRFVGGEVKSIHILVVEDDSFQRLLMIDILSLCNYEGKNIYICVYM